MYRALWIVPIASAPDIEKWCAIASENLQCSEFPSVLGCC